MNWSLSSYKFATVTCSCFSVLIFSFIFNVSVLFHNNWKHVFYYCLLFWTVGQACLTEFLLCLKWGEFVSYFIVSMTLTPIFKSPILPSASLTKHLFVEIKQGRWKPTSSMHTFSCLYSIGLSVIVDNKNNFLSSNNKLKKDVFTKTVIMIWVFSLESEEWICRVQCTRSLQIIVINF